VSFVVAAMEPTDKTMVLHLGAVADIAMMTLMMTVLCT